MKEFIKKNFALLLAFILPIALIIIVALSTYLPSLYISTHYNFLYASCTYGGIYYNSPDSCDRIYSVAGGRLVVTPVVQNLDLNKNSIPNSNVQHPARIFLHNTQTNESREISIDEALSLSLNDLLTSPDGVSVVNGYDRKSGGDFFFFPFGGYSSSSYGYYLNKGGSQRKLNLINNSDQYYYQNNFQFLGWISPGRN